MSGQPGQNSGWNRVSPEEHIRRGTYRPSRHAFGLAERGTPASPPVVAASPGFRRRALRAIGPVGRQVIRELLNEFGEWTTLDLIPLRQLGVCADRLAALEAADAPVTTRHAEARLFLALRRALGVDK